MWYVILITALIIISLVIFYIVFDHRRQSYTGGAAEDKAMLWTQVLTVYAVRLMAVIGLVGIVAGIIPMIFAHSLASICILAPMLPMVIYASVAWDIVAVHLITIALLLASGIVGFLYIKANIDSKKM